MRCVRPFGMVVSVSVAALLAGLAVTPAAAQTSADPGATLRPTLDGGPTALRRDTRRPPARPVPGRQTPPASTYGNPPGSGAGVTGFDSTNSRRGPSASPTSGSTSGTTSGAAPSGTARTIPSRAAPINPVTARQAARDVLAPATGLAPTPAFPLAMDPPRTSRRADPPMPGPDVRGPNRNRLGPEDDPFAPTTVHVGNFFVAPSVEIMGGYDNNPRRTPGGTGSSVLIVTPDVQVRSDFSRHQLNASLRGSYTAYGEAPEESRPSLDARVNGRIDVNRNTQIDVEGRYLLRTDSPGSPDIPAGLARLPLYGTLGGTVGLTRRFNRFEVTARTGIDRTDYQDSVFTDGSVASNEDRNFTQYSAALRTAYELSPAMKPFAEIAGDTRIRDLPVDVYGVQRDSVGATARLGTSFEFSRKFRGEVSAGYLVRSYKDPTLPDLTGLIADASLIWAATPLTTFKLTAASTADESTLTGVAGVLRRDGVLQVDHAFRRWLIVSAAAGIGTDDYEGAIREDIRYYASLGLTYKLTREMHAKAELRQQWLNSNVPGVDYTSTTALVGMRLAR